MPQLINAPTVIPVPGTPPKQIHEYIGQVNTGHRHISVAHMLAPAGWAEPGQRPEFQEMTVVLKGMVQVESAGETLQVRSGQAVITEAGEWVRYSSPEAEGAEYIAICLPAFDIETVHRDPEEA